MSALPGEDKRLTLSVNSIGEPYYSVFIPYFGTTGNRFNRHLTTAKGDLGLSYWSQQMKSAGWEDMSHRWIDFEDHILDFATDTLLPLMRGAHGFDADMAAEFTNRNAVTAFHILENIAADKHRTLPTCGEISTIVSGGSVDFSSGTNGTGIEWDFGDGNTGNGSSINHVYSSKGDYLVSATATSSDGTKNTKWCLVAITD